MVYLSAWTGLESVRLLWMPPLCSGTKLDRRAVIFSMRLRNRLAKAEVFTLRVTIGSGGAGFRWCQHQRSALVPEEAQVSRPA